MKSHNTVEYPTTQMLSGYSSYAPQLPETISVHPHFGSTRRFFVDGYVADAVDPNDLPCIQAWLPDGYSQIFRSYVFGPLGFWIMYGTASLCCKI